MQSLEKLREIFLKTGDCKHPKKFHRESKVFDVIIKDCGVCGHRISREVIH